MKRDIFLNGFIQDVGIAADAVSVSSEFDILAQKPYRRRSKRRSKPFSGI